MSSTLRTATVGLLLLSILASSAPVGAAAGGTAETTAAETCAFPVTRTDATGTEVTLSAEPERVVTLNPSAAQTMWEIGAREKVVGVTKYAANLDGAESRENVSTAESIVRVETVVGLDPDLVLAPNATSRETVRKLRDAGVTVYHFPEAENFDGIREKVRTTGRLVGACDGAARTVESMDRDLSVVREAVADRPEPDVLYTFYGYTAGKGTFVHTIIEAAGGNNVAAAANVTGYKPVNPEFVVKADPDWIIRNSDAPEVPATDAYNSTTAVREGQVIVVPIEHLNRPAPRVVNAVTLLARTFHPDAYAAAAETGTETEAEATADETPTSAAATTATDGTDEAATTEETPGFGVVSAVAALLVALGTVARRRR